MIAFWKGECSVGGQLTGEGYCPALANHVSSLSCKVPSGRWWWLSSVRLSRWSTIAADAILPDRLVSTTVRSPAISTLMNRYHLRQCASYLYINEDVPTALSNGSWRLLYCSFLHWENSPPVYQIQNINNIENNSSCFDTYRTFTIFSKCTC